MKSDLKRREFIKQAGAASISLSLPNYILRPSQSVPRGKRVGIIGLDTSHSPAFTKIFNTANSEALLKGYQVVAAYPQGSMDIPGSAERIPEYTAQVKEMGVDIVDSIDKLLEKVDVVLLETNDGRLHLEQALPVLKAGKKLFVDKPVTASLHDAIALYDAAEEYQTPVFSSSSLRYLKKAQDVRHNQIAGQVTGAMTFSPATLEAHHPDLFWYGIHGVEILFTVMGTGCRRVQRFATPDTDIVIGTWNDGRLGTFRGSRTGKHDYGGIAFGTEANVNLGPFDGYQNLVYKIAEFFESGKPPVSPKETLEIYAFMEAADESKRQDGSEVSLDYVMNKARNS
ncbi:Gfo/Idh/MocA family protein [Catalinimonas niigatensis]|uniref:Gfo/Idh/MocA family protein n=1 Tax=Catalinimonas niigatensis TaxID=1397264 RepID=UPI002666AECB|nr:Gfo/Idh/MocA family oxidoreductase [Catalinimonas niigatensis]WPP51264.1 Gfo/Idh/MocA family oxidoreductase [Catalinimonas niigatensis]